jgi:hypothetical protein
MPEHAVPFSSPDNIMREKQLLLVRPLAGIVGIMAVGVMVAGCAVFGHQVRPDSAAADNFHLSLKDQWAPEVISYAPPSVTKASHTPPPQPVSSPQLSAKAAAKDDTASCGRAAECLTRLKALVGDPGRQWVGQLQPPAEYANGTRQFAYRVLRSKLSCKELTRAIDETEAATRMFGGPVQGVAPYRIVRIRALNAQVEAELRAERARRCVA